jgi:hypothetical protein
VAVAAVTKANDVVLPVHSIVPPPVAKHRRRFAQRTLRPCCGTPGMGVNLWGESPLCEDGSLKEYRIPNVHSDRQSTRRRQLRQGNRTWEGSWSQTCEVTNRNRIQGRFTQASVPCNTKPFPIGWEGKCGACAGKVHVLIRGDLSDVPGSRACPKARAVHAKATRCRAEVSRRRSTGPHTPLRPERTERCRTRRSYR